MELLSSLNKYEEVGFLQLVQQIWDADVPKPDHDRLIAHFDKIVGHPAGADLLFYPGTEDTGIVNSPVTVVATIKHWHQSKGQQAFKNQAPLVPRKPPVKLGPKEKALEGSTRKLESVRKLVQDTQSASQAATRQLAALEKLLSAPPASGKPLQQLAAAQQSLHASERCHYQATRAVDQLKRLELSIKNALSAAQRDLTSSFSTRIYKPLC